MRYSTELEKEILKTILRNPSACITFKPEAYGADGQIRVHRDNLTMLLHRRLWTLVVGKLERSDYLLRVCDTVGCQIPAHRGLSSRSTRQRRGTCPNGHSYDPATDRTDGSLRCAICYQLRRERRGLKGTPDAPARNAAKKFCKAGHKFSKANTYVWTDKLGRRHRKCKACAVANRKKQHQPEGTK